MGVRHSVVRSFTVCWWGAEETKPGLAALSSWHRVRPQSDERCYHSRQEGAHHSRWLVFSDVDVLYAVLWGHAISS